MALTKSPEGRMGTISASEPQVLIAVLNWNRTEETIRCLESVFKQDYPLARVLLIDNGSVSGVVQTIRAWAAKQDLSTVATPADSVAPPPGIRELAIIETGKNLGYAAGNNVAFRLAINWGMDWVLVLNNDTRLPLDFVSQLLVTARVRPQAGLIGSRIVTPRNGLSYDGGRLLYAFGVYALWRWHGHHGEVQVNFVPGCAVLVRTAMLIDIGLFDEDYFLYTEDVDLSYRALKAGWQLIINLHTSVEHELSSSLGGPHTPLYYYYVTRNTLIFIHRRLSGFTRVSAFSFFAAQTLIRWALWATSGRHSHAQAVVNGVSDFAHNQSGPAPVTVERSGALEDAG